MKKIVRVFMVTLLSLSIFMLFGCSGESDEKKESSSEIVKSDAKTTDSETNMVKIEVEDYGDIVVKLDEKTAPITVKNFKKLVSEGFYDGLTFHRIISGFMIQGGDPKGDGTGGSDKEIKGEFSANGVENKISHKRGVISMARSQSFDSGSSQFFIVHKDSPHLDGQYAAFGEVTSGIEVVDKICEKVKVQDSNGTVSKGDQPKISSIKFVEE